MNLNEIHLPKRARRTMEEEEGTQRTAGADLLTKEQRVLALEEELVEVKAELMEAKRVLKKWSDLLEKAIAGEEEHKENKADYKEQKADALRRVEALEGRVKDLEGQLAVLRGEVPVARKHLIKLDMDAMGLPGFVVSETSQHKRLELCPSPQDRIVQLSRHLWNDPSGPKIIYLRECYAEFAEMVHRKFDEPNGDVMIAGTRGIGKSVFGLLMLLELVDKGNVVLYAHKKERMLVIGPYTRQDQLDALERCFKRAEFSYSLDEGVYEFPDEAQGLYKSMLRETVLINIQDLGDDREASIWRSGVGRKLILTSPNNKQLSTTHSMVGLLKLYMPRWSLEELLEVRETSFPEVPVELVREQFDFFGGIPRFILEMPPKLSKAPFEKQLALVTIADLANIFRTSSFIDLPNQKKTSYLIHVVPTKETASDGSYEDFKSVWASPRINKMLIDQFVQNQRFNVQAFEEAVSHIPEFASWRGYMLEAYAHYHLPRDGATLAMKILPGKGKKLKWEIPKMDTTIPPFDEIRHLSQVKVEQYLRPLKKNYPTIDACVVLDKSVFNSKGLALVLLQYTKKKLHVVNGSVIARLQREVFEKLDKSVFRKRVPRLDDLRIVLIFGTVQGGIESWQTLTNAEGQPYKSGEPKVAQYAMIMATEYQRLYKVWPENNDEKDDGLDALGVLTQ